MYIIRVLFIACCLSGAVAVMPGVAAQDVRPPLYKMRTLIGYAVESQQGKNLGDIEEVVDEVPVLLRVEHFQQGRRRVSPVIR